MEIEEWSDHYPLYKNLEEFKNEFLKDYYKLRKLNNLITLNLFLSHCFVRITEENRNLLEDLSDFDKFNQHLSYEGIINEIELELFRYSAYQAEREFQFDYLNDKIDNSKVKKTPTKLSNPKKLALLQELGIFDLPIMQNLTDDKQNEIVALLLDADKTEFVYKNRLNINSKNPSYQTDKYTSYQHLESMKQLLDDMK